MPGFSSFSVFFFFFVTHTDTTSLILHLDCLVINTNALNNTYKLLTNHESWLDISQVVFLHIKHKRMRPKATHLDQKGLTEF